MKSERCGAKTRSGGVCKARPMANGRCRIHGGKTPRGIASPNYIHGRYSKSLPAHLQERYEASLADSELLNLRQEIALLDARLNDLLARVDTGDSRSTLKNAREKYYETRNAALRNDKVEQGVQFKLLGEILDKGMSDYAAWDEVHTILDQRRRLVESEQKRLVAMQQTVTTEQAMVLISALLDSVRRHVTDRPALSAIQDEFIRLTTRADYHRLDSGRDG